MLRVTPQNIVLISQPNNGVGRSEIVINTQTNQTVKISKLNLSPGNLLVALIEASKQSKLARSTLGMLGLSGFYLNGYFNTFCINIGFNKAIEKMQNSFLFKPNHIDKFPPPDPNLISFEEISLKAVDGSKLHGYFFPKPDSDLAIIFFHGYSGSADEFYPDCLQIQKYINANVLIFSYQGFGKSEGVSTRTNVTENGEIMYKFLTEQKGFNGKKIILHGMSLGGAVAASLAHKLQKDGKPIGVLSLLYPFSSVRDIGKYRHPQIPDFLVFDDLLNTRKLVKRLEVPLFIGHGDNDKDTPLEQSKRIYKEARNLSIDQKALHVIKGIGHEDLHVLPQQVTEGYFLALKDFINKSLEN